MINTKEKKQNYNNKNYKSREGKYIIFYVGVRVHVCTCNVWYSCGYTFAYVVLYFVRIRLTCVICWFDCKIMLYVLGYFSWKKFRRDTAFTPS